MQHFKTFIHLQSNFVISNLTGLGKASRYQRIQDKKAYQWLLHSLEFKLGQFTIFFKFYDN